MPDKQSPPAPEDVDNSPAARNLPVPLASHLKSRRWPIAFTYALTGVEQGLDLLYPLLIGIAINGLLADQPVMLLPLIGVWFTHIAVEGLRQVYDTRLFAKLYADMATEIAVSQKATGHETGEISARADMAREYVDFFEIEIPSLAAILIGLAGGIVMIYFYDWIAGLIVTALMLPVGFINWILARRAMTLNTAINDQQERQVETIGRGAIRGLRRHFGRIARWRIRLSNADAAAWTAAETFTVVAFVAILYRLAGLPDANAGNIFAGVVYLLRVTDGLDHIPDAVQQIGRLIDIRRRIDRRDGAERAE